MVGGRGAGEWLVVLILASIRVGFLLHLHAADGAQYSGAVPCTHEPKREARSRHRKQANGGSGQNDMNVPACGAP